jgi:hypothetical protein
MGRIKNAISVWEGERGGNMVYGLIYRPPVHPFSARSYVFITTKWWGTVSILIRIKVNLIEVYLIGKGTVEVSGCHQKYCSPYIYIYCIAGIMVSGINRYVRKLSDKGH